MSIDYYVGDMVSKITRFDGSTISNTYDTAARLSTVTYRTAGVLPAPVAYGLLSRRRSENDQRWF